MLALSSCFLQDLLPTTTKKTTRIIRRPSPTTPPEIEEQAGPTRLAAGRLVRRLSLDLKLGLPYETDLSTLEGNANALSIFIDSYIGSQDAAKAIAQLHKRVWHLDGQTLPDLDRFVAGGDTALQAALTPAQRRNIAEEALHTVRYVIEQDLPFRAIFDRSFTIAHSDLLSLWGLSDAGEVWPGEPYRFGSYGDQRPNAGILAAHGLLAHFDSRSDRNLDHRTANMMRTLQCTTPEDEDSHLFYDLTTDQLAGDLAALAKTNEDCRGCHGRFSESSSAFSGLADATTFSSWLTYAAPTTTPSGYYVGHQYTGLGNLASFVGQDARTHVCEVTRLMETLFQRPFFRRDEVTIAVATHAFHSQNQNLRAAVKAIVSTSDYAFGPADSKTKGAFKEKASGARFLTATALASILAELSPAAGQITVSPEIIPGKDETVSSVFAIPTGSYWHRVRYLAQAAATAIVDDELADNTLAESRVVLGGLPDGSGASASDAQIDAQLIAIWRQLVGATIAADSTEFTELQTLWTSALNGDSSETNFRVAWRAVLTGVLSHPRFLMY